MTQGDQLGDSPAVAFLDQPERVRSVVRRTPDGVGAARALFPSGLAGINATEVRSWFRSRFKSKPLLRAKPEPVDNAEPSPSTQSAGGGL